MTVVNLFDQVSLVRDIKVRRTGNFLDGGKLTENRFDFVQGGGFICNVILRSFFKSKITAGWRELDLSLMCLLWIELTVREIVNFDAGNALFSCSLLACSPCSKRAA